MIDAEQFKQLQKRSAKSFNDQKALIKKVMAGRTIACTVCGEALMLFPPESSDTPGIRCRKQCTVIELDFI